MCHSDQAAQFVGKFEKKKNGDHSPVEYREAIAVQCDPLLYFSIGAGRFLM